MYGPRPLQRSGLAMDDVGFAPPDIHGYGSTPVCGYNLGTDFTITNAQFAHTTVDPRLAAPVLVSGSRIMFGKAPKPRDPLSTLDALQATMARVGGKTCV